MPSPTTTAPAPLTLTLHVTEQRPPAAELLAGELAPDAYEGSYCCYCCTCDFAARGPSPATA